MTDRDDLYQHMQPETSGFRFDEAVARVFPDMIKRSVPGYAESVAMSGVIASRYAQPDSRLYDFGCSLGAVTLALRHGVTQPGCTVIGIDNSEAMLDQARHYVAIDDHTLAGDAVPVELMCADICDIRPQNASVSALNYVLQFIEPDKRLALLQNIAAGTLPGGALILSEKLCFEPEEQAIQDHLHLGFKRANGYSDLEIARKRSAIENVLIPESEECHRQRLLDAGFSRVVRWYQCFNFVSLLAIK